jgi:hypothetical protein
MGKQFTNYEDTAKRVTEFEKIGGEYFLTLDTLFSVTCFYCKVGLSTEMA